MWSLECSLAQDGMWTVLCTFVFVMKVVLLGLLSSVGIRKPNHMAMLNQSQVYP